MEDPYPVEDWSIQEYLLEQQSGKLRWILNKGLNVGKKILVTGFVISSAPLVLPPLVVISIIGFACLVPSGILLASYACTDRLMSKLLLESKPPPFSLEYGTVYNDEVVNDESGGGENLGLKGDFYLGKEEEDILNDTWGNVEMRIELVDEKNNDEAYEGKALVGDEHEQGGVRKDVQELMSDKKETVGENGYQDVGEYEYEEGEEPAKEIEVKIEIARKEEEKEPGVEGRSDQVPVDEVQVVVDIAGDEISGRTLEEEGTPVFEMSDVVVEVYENKEIEEDEELLRETRGLLERIREEGMTDNREDDKQSLGKLSDDKLSLEKLSAGTEERDWKVDWKVEPLRESERKIEENKHDEIQKESSEKQESGHMENVDIVPEEVKPIEPVEGLLGKRKVDNILEAEKSRGEVNGTTNVGTTKEEPKPEKERLPASQGGRADDSIKSNAEEDNLLNREKETVISTNADAREIADESGFDLYDKKNVAPQHCIDTDYNTVVENEARLEATDYMELPASVGEHERNGTAGISSQKDFGMASSKILYSEKKLWQQINAMRKIVGYKAAKRATCFEELRALYLFTGVEPPASFKDPFDLVEINDKLRFLMSIVGVK